MPDVMSGQYWDIQRYTQQISSEQVWYFWYIGDVVGGAGCLRHFRAFFDETLSFKEHAQNKCPSAKFNFFRIKCTKKYLTKAVFSHVISHLDHCNVILYGIFQTGLRKIQHIQNMSAKLVLNRGKLSVPNRTTLAQN